MLLGLKDTDPGEADPQVNGTFWIKIIIKSHGSNPKSHGIAFEGKYKKNYGYTLHEATVFISSAPNVGISS
jgi:hypothetical protein